MAALEVVEEAPPMPSAWRASSALKAASSTSSSVWPVARVSSRSKIQHLLVPPRIISPCSRITGGLPRRSGWEPVQCDRRYTSAQSRKRGLLLRDDPRRDQKVLDL